jgi:hypothetical protein
MHGSGGLQMGETWGHRSLYRRSVRFDRLACHYRGKSSLTELSAAAAISASGPLCEVASSHFKVCSGVVSRPELLRSSVSHFDPERTLIVSRLP